MATTKKASTGTEAGAGARKGASKANGVAKETQSKPTAGGAASPKRAAPIKLNDRQREFLKKVQEGGAAGYEAQKGEQRTFDALLERKLVKRGAKNKETGNPRYLLTRAGEKYLPPAPPTPPAPAEPAPAPATAPATTSPPSS